MSGANTPDVRLEATLADNDIRVDAFIARHLHWRSRDSVAALCAQGAVRVNGTRAKKSRRLRAEDIVEIVVDSPDLEHDALAAVELRILFEDDELVVVDKPPGIAVHPASTCQHVNMLRRLDLEYRAREVRPVPVPSIVHRIDRNTSGVIAFAKRRELVVFYTGQFERRTTRKTYSAIVHGVPADTGIVDTPLVVADEQPVAVGPGGKPSETGYSVVRRGAGLSLLEVVPVTGRKHQIRVHLASVGHPIVFDDLYGRVDEIGSWPATARVMLHAKSLELDHRSGQRLRFEAPIPADMERLLELGLS